MKKDRNSLKRTKQPPVWRREPFPRVNGIMDALLRKVGFKTETYGAWFVKLSRKLELFEVEACIDLHRRAAPLQLAILNARQITSLDIEQEEKSAPPLTTQEARIAKVRSEQEQRLLMEKKNAANQVEKLEQELQRLADDTAARIQEAYAQANVAAVKYAKATAFAPISEKEIPYFTPNYKGGSVHAVE